eukprot:2675211-Lingulodinium_polyedra.AAC.1
MATAARQETATVVVAAARNEAQVSQSAALGRAVEADCERLAAGTGCRQGTTRPERLFSELRHDAQSHGTPEPAERMLQIIGFVQA